MRKVWIVMILVIIYLYCSHWSQKYMENRITPIKYTHGVPKVIYRTHRSRDVPMSMAVNCHEKWLNMNPDYSMVWFTDIDCDTFMKKLNPRITSAYNKLKPGAFKADLWRACILYEKGGVYVDSFCTPATSLNLILSNCWNKHIPDQFISVKDVDHINNDGKMISGIHNGFIVATKRHPFLKQYIDDIVSNVEANFYGEHFLDVTGPFCLMRAINKVNGRSVNYKSHHGYNHSKFPYFLFEYNLFHPYQRVSKNSIPIMYKKYSIISYLHEKILRMRKNYAMMWKNKDIYRLDNSF